MHIKNLLRTALYKWLLCNKLADCETFLDVGCGEALFKDVAGVHGRTCYGVDIAPTRSDVRCMDYSQWTDKVDCVFASQFIEHVDGFRFTSWIQQINPKKVVVITPHPHYAFWDDPDHIRPWTPESLKELFRRNGYRRIWRLSLPFFKSHVGVFQK